MNSKHTNTKLLLLLLLLLLFLLSLLLLNQIRQIALISSIRSRKILLSPSLSLSLFVFLSLHKRSLLNYSFSASKNSNRLILPSLFVSYLRNNVKHWCSFNFLPCNFNTSANSFLLIKRFLSASTLPKASHAYHTSYIIHYTSYIIHRTFIHHTSYITHHTAYIQWVVCLSRPSPLV